MKKIKLFPIILIICLVLASAAPAAYALDDPNVSGKAMLLIELNSGVVLYERSSDAERAPASLTKIMTALLALEAIDRGDCTLDEIVTAPADCLQGLEEDSSTSGIQPGMQLSMRELLYCALLQSANEACNIIGSRVSGSVTDFVALMNQKAADLGCAHTHFMNTNGLPAENHYSSAYDLYLITSAAMSYPLFMEICNSTSYQPENTAINNGNTIYNSNALICAGSIYGSGYLYEYASGVKTGYTRAAGYCLVSTAKKEGVSLMAVVLGCDGQLNSDSEDFWNFIDSRVLYDWGYENFAYRTIVSATEPITKAAVELSANGGEAVLRPASDLTVFLPNDVPTESISRSVTVFDDKLKAPIAAGTVLGEMTLSSNGTVYGKVNLVNSADIELSKGEYLRQRVQEILSKGWVIALILIVAVFLAIYTVLVVRYRRLRQKHLRERRKAEMRRRAEREQRYGGGDYGDGGSGRSYYSESEEFYDDGDDDV